MRNGLWLILFLLCDTMMAQLGGGPSILSRGSAGSRRGGRDPLFFRAYADVGFSYETGISPIAVDSQGRLESVNLYGVEANIGAYASRAFRRSTLTFDYRADFRHYANNSSYDGTDQYVSLTADRQFTRRWSLGIRELAGTLSRTNSGYIVSQLNDPSLIGVPTNELFDNRSYFLQSSMQAAYQKTARLSFLMEGDGYLVRRRSQLLVESDGYAANGAVNYRLSRTLDVQAFYSFTHYEFRRAFGGSDLHGFGGGFSKRFSEVWSLSLAGGAYRIESLGSRTVLFDPAIQALTGRAGGVEAFYDIRYTPNVMASLNRRWAKSSLAFTYSQAVTPGNGLFLTSTNQSGTANFSHTASRRWNVGASGGVQRSDTILDNATSGATIYSTAFGGGGFTYRLNEMLHLNGRADWRRYMVDVTSLQRNSMRVMISVAFSPGSVPLSLW